MITTVTDRGVLEIDREEFAKIVRAAWSDAVRQTIRDAPASWVKQFDDLPEHMKNTERLQGDLILAKVNEALAQIGMTGLAQAALFTVHGDDNCRNGKGGRDSYRNWSQEICSRVAIIRKEVHRARKERAKNASTS